jgi:uncharacterized membrane protein YcaP (DUF421 family)
MDWRAEILRILFGEEETQSFVFFAEVVLRTIVMYCYTLFLTRMVGNGGIGQIGPFEFVLVIAVGSAAGDPMFYPEVGLATGILVITVVILLHRLTGFVVHRFRTFEDVIEGSPVLVVTDGGVCFDRLGSGTLTERELMALLRIEGVRDTGEVERAFFEPNGRLSVFLYEEKDRRAVRRTIPDDAETRFARR